jgi:hypothetical protein
MPVTYFIMISKLKKAPSLGSRRHLAQWGKQNNTTIPRGRGNGFTIVFARIWQVGVAKSRKCTFIQSVQKQVIQH